MVRRALLSSAVVLGLIGVVAARANTTFTVADPPVAFDVIDDSPFDGHGDQGIFMLFGIVRGTVGEERGMVEFDISEFTLPAGESITGAHFQVQVSHNVGGGMGCPWGQLPNNLAAHGYVGDGVANLSDFEAGDANFLDRVPVSNVQVGDVLTFDVTSFVTSLVDAGQTWVGLTVQAESIGALAIWDGPVGYPNLTIETTAVPEPAALTLLSLGLMVLHRRGRS